MKYFLHIIFLSVSLCSVAQENTKIMFSNQKTVKYKINDGLNEWVIMPELKPDVLNLYDAKAKSLKVSFISDVDSVNFKVKTNKPIRFRIILNKKDTAQVEICLTNKIAEF